MRRFLASLNERFWRPVDLAGRAFVEWWKPVRQLRTGVLAIAGGIVIAAVGPMVDEPPLVYQMSAMALILGGAGIAVTAVLALKQDPDSSEDDLLP